MLPLTHPLLRLHFTDSHVITSVYETIQAPPQQHAYADLWNGSSNKKTYSTFASFPFCKNIVMVGYPILTTYMHVDPTDRRDRELRTYMYDALWTRFF